MRSAGQACSSQYDETEQNSQMLSSRTAMGLEASGDINDPNP